MWYTHHMKRIILASSSPRRIEMMKNNGFEPEIMPADVTETLPMNLSAESSAMYLAMKKALYVKASLDADANTASADAANGLPTVDDGAIIIAADTIVVHAGKIIGKPKNEVDAFLTLRRLRSSCHQVITGVCIIDTAENIKRCFHETTNVYFTDYTDEELNEYVNTQEPYDKAGGYAIQGTFKKYIDHIDGDFDNVVGFPWSRIEPYFDDVKHI